MLHAPVGNGSDPLKAVLRDGLTSLGARSDGLLEMQGRTPCVNMSLDENGDLAAGVAQTDLVEQLTGVQVSRYSGNLEQERFTRQFLASIDHRQPTII